MSVICVLTTDNTSQVLDSMRTLQRICSEALGGSADLAFQAALKKTVKGFEVGDRVSWMSQAGSYSLKKAGTVWRVVAPDEIPDFKALRSQFSVRADGNCMGRDHESYLVSVPQGPRAKLALYWPRVSQLRLAKAEE